MDWKGIVGPIVQQFAPTLAKGLLGQIPVAGPLILQFGGQAIDAALGGLIASAFGLDAATATPEAVNAAIQATPSDVAAAKLQAVEAEAQAKYPALGEIAKAEEETARTQIVTTAESMKTEILAANEIADGRWRVIIQVLNGLWRPLFALEWLLECMCFAVLLGIKFAQNDPFGVEAFLKLQFLIGLYMAARFGLLGYHMNLRTREKEAVTEAVTDAPKAVSLDDIKGLLKAGGIKFK